LNDPGARAVLLTGVYGSGKSSVAAEIAFLLEQQEAIQLAAIEQRLASDVMTFLGWP
jgi:adenylylsulfate kinase-like enzyme